MTMQLAHAFSIKTAAVSSHLTVHFGSVQSPQHQCSVPHLGPERCIPVVLDRILCAPGQLLGDLGP